MPLSADALLDRLYLKKQITRWRAGAIVAIVVALMAVFNKNSTTSSSPMEREYVARVTIDGIVTDDRAMLDLIEDLRENSKVKAVVLSLNTPGGSAVGGQEMFAQVRALSAKKPVVAVMRDLSASAGYMIAIAADRVFAREGTLTGSIGVIIETAEFSDLAQKIGITPIIIKTGALKDALSPTKKATPEALAAMQSVIDDFFQVFISMVSERRGLPQEEVLKLADGRIFTGRQALGNKLIDALGGEEDARNWLETEKKLPKTLEIKDVEPKKPELPWLKQITESTMQKFMPTASAKLDGLVSIWHPALQLQPLK